MLSALGNFGVLTSFVVIVVSVFVGIKSDLSFHSKGFMDNNSVVVNYTSFNELSARQVASSKNDKIRLVYFPLSDENYQRISGKWRIYNYIDVNDKDEQVNATINLELVGNSKVVIDGDASLEFRISYLTSHNTIALVRKVGSNYEILEAEKIKEESVEATVAKANDSDKKKEPKGVKIIEGDLILEKATNPSKSPKIMAGELVKGSMSIMDNSINNFEAVIYNEDGTYSSIDFTFATINDGGQFEVELAGITSQGIFTNNGEDAFRIRFATGPHAGLLLNFITEDKWYENREAAQEKADESSSGEETESRLVVKKLNVEQAEVVNERSNQAQIDREDYSEVTEDEISPEEMAERLKNSSFDFSESSATTI